MDMQDKKCAFFINLYNFIVLYTLCKTSPQLQYSSQDFWLDFLGKARMKIGPFEFTAQMIELVILKANGYGLNSKDYSLPFCKPNNDIMKFICKEQNLLVNFALFLPVRY